MFCPQPYDLIGYLKEELPAPEAESVRAHLGGCAECRRELLALERVLGFVRSVPDVEPDLGFVARVLDALPAQAAAPARRREETVPAWTVLVQAIRARLAGFPVWALSVSAHLILFAVLTVLFFNLGVDRGRDTAGRNPTDAPANGTQYGAKGATEPDRDVHPTPTQEPRVPDLREPLPKPDDPLLALVALRTDAALRRKALEAAGGKDVPPAVAKGLAWLAKKQLPDGKWDAASDGGKAEDAAGLTGLATLAFLADGQSHRAGEHRDAVEKSLTWLLRNQRHDGLLGPENANCMASHGIATLALLEALILTGDEHLRMPAEAATFFIIHAQNEKGGWGGAVRTPDADLAVTAWQMQALRMAQAWGIRGAGVALKKAADWVATASGEPELVVFCGGIGGRKPTGADALAKTLPGADPQAGTNGASVLTRWYFTSLALSGHDGEAAQAWNAAVWKALLDGQGRDGAEAGSWGRVYTTSMGVLTLTTPYRYPRLDSKQD